jgi:hypothetical protein
MTGSPTTVVASPTWIPTTCSFDNTSSVIKPTSRNPLVGLLATVPHQSYDELTKPTSDRAVTARQPNPSDEPALDLWSLNRLLIFGNGTVRLAFHAACPAAAAAEGSGTTGPVPHVGHVANG